MDPISINNGNESQKTQSKTFTMYDMLKKDYENFVKKMDKSEFKNAYTRYMTEQIKLTSIKQEALKEGLTKEAEEIQAKLDAVNNILKEKFGITITENKTE